MNLALFGGTFDPIHLGHTALAEHALKQAGLDRVVFIPCRQSPHKSSATTATERQRTEMIRLAIADLPWAELSTLELERDGPSYSWLTAQTFAKERPRTNLFWILGADQWEALPTWAEPKILGELLNFLVLPRGAESSLSDQPGFRGRVLSGFQHPASATQIRSSTEAARTWLDPSVFDYAATNRIYPWAKLDKA